MKNIKQLFLFVTLLFVTLFGSANAQITSISQLKDVKPTDKHYQELRNLIERYGVFEPYPDYTFRGNLPLTRGEFVKLLNTSLERLGELAGTQEVEILNQELFNSFNANNTNISALSQVKDIRPSNEYYTYFRSLIERFGIDICDADKYCRPEKTVTEKEFYTWITKIFGGEFEGTLSATKMVSRSDFVIVMSNALYSVEIRIVQIVAEKVKAKKKDGNVSTKPKPNDSAQLSETNKIKIIQNLPSKGKGQIKSKSSFYLPDNPCADLSNASNDLKIALQKGGVWGSYRMDKGDIGDIVYETNNTCRKGKLILLRVGTAIVTIGEQDIKRL